ncbi:hypothetical protein U6A24_03985 [Aquimarina gracilis]|uniref:Uncharacterized protein n=1 Tax=Aquimarina gracilis TaxID=874422 RepID=A0ABU5ZRA3_9FLAO|nr:hypothetical protein [Aquimarina gracilis]MEB3344606.1 hypothetical protein [Aquimarina gracilis]
MSNTITIAGISFTLNFCHKTNDTPIPSNFISKQPIANIYKSSISSDLKKYIVNIVAHLPENLQSLADLNLSSGLFLNEDKTIFFNYSGVSKVTTAVDKSDNGVLLCREFNIEYDCEDEHEQIKNYNLYHIQFEYELLPKSFQSVEAIIVHDINEDPETDRGTVTTVRTDDQ